MGKLVEQMYDLKLEYDTLINDIHKQIIRTSVQAPNPPPGEPG